MSNEYLIIKNEIFKRQKTLSKAILHSWAFYCYILESIVVSILDGFVLAKFSNTKPFICLYLILAFTILFIYIGTKTVKKIPKGYNGKTKVKRLDDDFVNFLHEV